MKVGKYYQAFLALVCSFVLIFAVFPAKSQSELEFPGSETLPEGYLSDLEYKDHTIHVKITAHRAFETDYWVASISIAQPDQLRTASAAGFESQRTMKGKVLAQRVHAAFATNGDYFSYIPDGYLIRQGVLYRNLPNGKRDVLLIDDKGDFHIELQAGDGIHEAYQDKGIVNSFNFGPALVVDGTRVTEYIDENNAALKGRQRMAIAQVKRGSLEYILVACAGPKGKNKGMTLYEFSQIIAQQGVENAYNLDGGYSTMMIFKDEYINSDYEKTMRKISDIIYFVSLHETIPRAD
jgi:exopolysaccharide biosynthesis protein